MKNIIIFISIIICLYFVSSTLAEDKWPPEKLSEKGRDNIKTGTIALKAWKNKDKYPELTEISDMTLSGRKRDDGVEWIKGKAEIVVGSNKIYLGTLGRIENSSDAYDWAPMILFTPKTQGTFSISGILKASQKKEDNDVKAVKWAVFVIDKKNNTSEIASGILGEDEIIDLSDFGKNIKLKNEESLAISAWRSRYHWWAGVNLSDFSIKRIK